MQRVVESCNFHVCDSSCVCVCVSQVAMQRAKVCVRSVTVSGESHLRLVKVRDMQSEIADHEAAYLDNTGMCVCVLSVHCWLMYRSWRWQEKSRAVGWIFFTVSTY